MGLRLFYLRSRNCRISLRTGPRAWIPAILLPGPIPAIPSGLSPNHRSPRPSGGLPLQSLDAAGNPALLAGARPSVPAPERQGRCPASSAGPRRTQRERSSQERTPDVRTIQFHPHRVMGSTASQSGPAPAPRRCCGPGSSASPSPAGPSPHAHRGQDRIDGAKAGTNRPEAERTSLPRLQGRATALASDPNTPSGRCRLDSGICKQKCPPSVLE